MSDNFIPEDGPSTPLGLFSNSYKRKDTHPDYVGNFVLTDTLLKQIIALRNTGKVATLGVAGWPKQTKNGDNYMSCQVRVDTYKTARRYNVEESVINEIISGSQPTQTQNQPPQAQRGSDPFLGTPAPPAQPQSPPAPDPFNDPLPGSDGGGEDDPFGLPF